MPCCLWAGLRSHLAGLSHLPAIHVVGRRNVGRAEKRILDFKSNSAGGETAPRRSVMCMRNPPVCRLERPDRRVVASIEEDESAESPSETSPDEPSSSYR